MRRADAERIAETVQAAWDWVMASETHERWVAALERLSDAETAELAVIELYDGWTRQRGRPLPGDVREQYNAVSRRHSVEQATLLPPGDETGNAPPELRELVARLRTEGKRGGELVRGVLAANGVAAPIDEGHAGAYDPPLTPAEQRHSTHLFQRAPAPDHCRFCRQPEKEGRREETEESATA